MRLTGSILIVAGVVLTTIAAAGAMLAFVDILGPAVEAGKADALAALVLGFIGIGAGILGALIRHWN
jgi:hypothetical protein